MCLKRPSVARIQIELDLLKPRHDKIWINVGSAGGYWQKVEYENLPHYCTHCMHVGHQEQLCTFHNPELKAQEGKRPTETGQWVQKTKDPLPKNPDMQHHTVLTKSLFQTLRSDLAIPRLNADGQDQNPPHNGAEEVEIPTLGNPEALKDGHSSELASSAAENISEVTKDQNVALAVEKPAGEYLPSTAAIVATPLEEKSNLEDLNKELLDNSMMPHQPVNDQMDSADDISILLPGQQPLTKVSPQRLSPQRLSEQNQSDALVAPLVALVPVPLHNQATPSPRLLDESSLQECVSIGLQVPTKPVAVQSSLNPLAPAYLSPTPSEAYRSPYQIQCIEEGPAIPFLGVPGFQDSDYYQDSNESGHFDEEDEAEEGRFDITDGSEDTIRQKRKGSQKLKALEATTLPTKEVLEEQSRILGKKIKKRGRPPGSRNRTFFDVIRTMDTRNTKPASS